MSGREHQVHTGFTIIAPRISGPLHQRPATWRIHRIDESTLHCPSMLEVMFENIVELLQYHFFCVCGCRTWLKCDFCHDESVLLCSPSSEMQLQREWLKIGAMLSIPSAYTATLQIPSTLIAFVAEFLCDSRHVSYICR